MVEGGQVKVLVESSDYQVQFEIAESLIAKALIFGRRPGWSDPLPGQLEVGRSFRRV